MSERCKDSTRLSVSAVDAVTPGPRGDLVSNPAHYTRSPIEPIAVIEAWGLGFHLGNAVKYIARAGFKAGAQPADDLAKAVWYLERARENLLAAPQLPVPVYSCTFPTDPVSAGLRELEHVTRGVVQIDLSDVEDA